MSGKQAERRLRERVKAWQTARLCEHSPRNDRPGKCDSSLKLEQRLEEEHPRLSPPPCSSLPEPIRPSPAEMEKVFRAGQIWRRLDRQMDFIVDFSDGEQIEIRWFLNLQWGSPHTLSVHDLLTYVRAKNVWNDWPQRT